MLPFDGSSPTIGATPVKGQRFSRLTDVDNNRVKALQRHTMPYRMRASVTESIRARLSTCVRPQSRIFEKNADGRICELVAEQDDEASRCKKKKKKKKERLITDFTSIKTPFLLKRDKISRSGIVR